MATDDTTETTMTKTTAPENLTYEAFVALYSQAFMDSNRYNPNQAGFGIYVGKMADLADAYPAFLERFEASVDEVEGVGIPQSLGR